MSTLEARIAEVLADHIERKTLDDYCEGCSCGWKAGLADAHEEHAAAMLLPVILEAQAEALRGAVSDFESHIGVGEFAELSQRGPMPWGHLQDAWEHQGPYMDWLRTRADNLEKP